MRYRIAVEDMEPNHYIAWVLDLPGCFSSAPTQEGAVIQAPDRIGDYYVWLVSHEPALPLVSGPFEVEVVETFQAFASAEDPDFLVNAFFEADRRPLGYWDIEVGLRLLQWTRQDLLKVVEALPDERLYQSIPGEVYNTIAGIFDHIARAENWYLSQLDLALDRSTLPDDPLDKLGVVRAHTRTQLVKLIGDERITKDRGEFWSARKVLRRALWHEQDHTQHIAQLGSG